MSRFATAAEALSTANKFLAKYGLDPCEDDVVVFPTVDPVAFAASLEEAEELYRDLGVDVTVAQWPFSGERLEAVMLWVLVLLGGDFPGREIAYIDHHGVRFAEGVEDPRAAVTP